MYKTMEIQDYPNYLIHEDGQVYNKKYNRFLKKFIDKDGYYRVFISKNNKTKGFSIHRLIAIHYIPNPENKKQVDHIDRDRINNNINNLRWVSHEENMNNTNIQKNNKLGIKNISISSSGYFRFCKYRNGKTHEKYFKTLEEAIKYKEEYFQK